MKRKTKKNVICFFTAAAGVIIYFEARDNKQINKLLMKHEYRYEMEQIL